MSSLFMYVVDRDFGFAPNPFHGMCTLATCMPRVRRKAVVDDWIVGVGGSRLKATGRCVYAMRVTTALTFNDYWSGGEYFDKRPVSNGSRTMMVGDNIYHRPDSSSAWHQMNSHHSNPDGTINLNNLAKDTSADRVLISRDFYYFGSAAPAIPPVLLRTLGYKNGLGHRRFTQDRLTVFLNWIRPEFEKERNMVSADPFDFERSEKRYSGVGSALR